MTAPRRVLPGRTYLITRRCSERRHFLRPDPKVTSIFEYLLAHACSRYSIDLHAFVAMSNHYHLVVTDPLAQLPAFQQYLNSLLARAINRLRNRREAFWDRESYNAVELLESYNVIAKMAYTLLNPVRAGLVDRVSAWEGATSAKLCFGCERVLQRPTGFVRDTKLPDRVTLKLTPPSVMSPHDIQDGLSAVVEQGEREALRGGRPIGMREVLARWWGASPKTREPRRQLRPRFAARSREVRIQALLGYRHWIDAYRAALARFRAGDRGVEFPPGTWRMCRQLDCCCRQI